MGLADNPKRQFDFIHSPRLLTGAFASTCNVAAGARFDGVPGIMHAAPAVMHVTSE